jgi:hypothetical protein
MRQGVTGGLDDVFSLFSHIPMSRSDELPFRIEQWSATSQGVEELIATSSDLRVAQAAFGEAVRRRPAEIITLRQGARVIRSSDDEGKSRG